MNNCHTPPHIPFRITDDRAEMESLGRQIVAANPEIYTDRVVGVIKGHIDKMMPNASAEEKTSVYYRSVYDYWAYGDTVMEEFCYGFLDKSHEEKSEYLVMRNRILYCDHMNDKEDAINLLDNKYGAYKFLRQYYRRDAFIIHDETGYDEFCAFVSKHPSFIIKPVNFGIGLYVSRDSVDNYANPRELFDKLLSERIRVANDPTRVNLLQISGEVDLILEEPIKQDSEIAKIHPASVNCIRITTVKSNGKIFLWYPFFKSGRNGRITDNVGAGGGFLAGVNALTGVVETDGFDETEYCHRPLKYHPNTHIQIKGFKIPRWDEAVALAKECASKFDNVNYVGWDLALTPDGWCVVEGNNYGDFVGPQIAYGRGMRREFEELIGWKSDKQFWWQ